MNPKLSRDESLSAWLDGEGLADDRARTEEGLRQHPDDAATVGLWAADRDALRARFNPVLDEPLPPALLAAVQARSAAPAWNHWLQQPWAQAAAAAGLLIAGGLLGAGGLWQWQARGGETLASQAVTTTGWTHRAAVAHVVYTPEVKHPVEVSVVEGSAAEQRAQEQHLARWLTKRLDMPVRLFDLRAQGFELVGGRLLPDTAGPGAQLMYQNGQGERVTVYLRKPEPGTRTAFRYQRDGQVGMFFWAEDGYGCALLGQLPRERLLALAEAVYRQVEAASGPAAPVPVNTPAAPPKPLS